MVIAMNEKVKTEISSEGGTTFEKMYYDGKLMQETITDEKGVTLLQYDTNGNKISRFYKPTDNSLPTERSLYKYSDNNIMLEESYSRNYPDGTRNESIDIYDNSGNHTGDKTINYYPDGTSDSSERTYIPMESDRKYLDINNFDDVNISRDGTITKTSARYIKSESDYLLTEQEQSGFYEECDHNIPDFEDIWEYKETIIKPDGTTIETSNYSHEGCHNKDRFNYTIWNDDIVTKKDGTREVFHRNEDGKYENVAITHSDGTTETVTYEYDENGVIKGNKRVLNGNNVIDTQSKFRHIEYDEEAYNTILNTFNNVESNSIINSCINIENVTTAFPDKYSNTNINNLSNHINSHLNLIKSLGEMTNYSLLAYETCDESLRKGLYLLVDSLFNDSDRQLGEKFKRAINNFIDDNDKILKYKEGTDFKRISENAIVNLIYTDEDGNKWYLNKNNIVIGIEGKNIKINHGGEIFNVTYEGNAIKLFDSNGNPLNIFGEYNIESYQYGGDQHIFFERQDMLLKDEKINDIFNKYTPVSTTEERAQYLTDIYNLGCGKMAMTNVAFKMMEGKEEEFLNTFGYSMYDVKMVDGKLAVDYNYEPLTLELSMIYSQSGGPLGLSGEGGTDKFTSNIMGDFLDNRYNIFDGDGTKECTYIADSGYNLYTATGEVILENGGGHCMVKTGETDDGRLIVSSWGEKCILSPSDRCEYVVYNNSK